MLGNDRTYSRGVSLNRESRAREWLVTYTPESLASCYVEELAAFLEGRPLCTGREGLAVVNLMEEIR